MPDPTTDAAPQSDRILRGPILWALAAGLLLASATGAWFILREGPAADGPRLPSGQFGGAVTAVGATRQGDQAWLGAGPRLVGVDLTDPARAVQLGQSEPLGTAIRAVAVDAAGHAYVALGTGGLAVFDVADAARPRRIGALSTAWSVNDIALASDGRTGYLAEGSRGLRVVDLSRGADPVELGRLDTPGDALAVTLDGAGRAYVADWGTGVRIVDVTEPEAPRELGWIDTPGEAADVAAAGTLILVADRLEGVRLVDAADPAAPRELGRLALTSGSAERVAMEADGLRGYVAAQDGGLLALDLADPARPRLLGRSADVKVAMDLALVEPAGGAPELRVLAADVGTNVAPARDSRADLWTRMHLWGVEGAPKVAAGLAGLLIARPTADGLETLGLYFSPSLIEGLAADPAAGLLYLADGHAGLVLVDLAQADAPRLIGSIDSAGVAHDVKLTADRAYLADGPTGVVELDRSDPRAPRPLRTLDTPGEAMGLEVDAARQLLYVADGNAGVITIDLATGERLQQLDTPGYSWDIALGLGHAFVSDRKGGLRILSLADPRQPLEVGTVLEGAGEVLDVVVAGSRLWVSGGPAGVQVLDAADPAAPRLLGSLIVDDRAIGMLVDGDRAWVAAGSAGLRQLDVADPTRLRETGAWQMPGAAERLVYLKDRIFVAAEMGGLQVVRP